MTKYTTHQMREMLRSAAAGITLSTELTTLLLCDILDHLRQRWPLDKPGDESASLMDFRQPSGAPHVQAPYRLHSRAGDSPMRVPATCHRRKGDA